MKILLTATQRGSTNVLDPVAKELLRRNHEVNIYATGNESEAAGFNMVAFKHIQPGSNSSDNAYAKLVEDCDVVVVGLSGYDTPDGRFLRAAISEKIPVIAVQDQNSNYVGRLGTNPLELPTLLAVMNDACIETARMELGGEMGEEAAKRGKVVGWTAFDSYARMRDDFSHEDRAELLDRIGVDPQNPTYVHFTQNIHPHAAYRLRNSARRNDKNITGFLYEQGVTQFVCEAASDLGLKLILKPHPGEKYDINYTKNLADRHGFMFVSADGCNTQQLMLAAYSVTAGQSTCLTEATLLGKNTGGILPDLGEEKRRPFPPVMLGAIPFTLKWSEIGDVLSLVTSSSDTINRMLGDGRKRFSVDGKASKRVADLVESLG
jgi:hypothetical protein